MVIGDNLNPNHTLFINSASDIHPLAPSIVLEAYGINLQYQTRNCLSLLHIYAAITHDFLTWPEQY